MSVPPQGGWPPPQQPGQGPFNPQQPGPPAWQQGGWAPQPSPPPPKGNNLKWLLIGVAVLLVIAISVGATLLFTRGSGGGGGGTSSTSAAPNDVASANDKGPVAIITDEPTCNSFTAINNSLATAAKNGWADQRATLGPSADWTASQRAQVDAMSNAVRNSTDEVMLLAKQTPHRTVRELYEQFVAYGRAYADSIPDYQPIDNNFADVFVDAGTAIIGICNSIELGSASRSVLIDKAQPPARPGRTNDGASPARFMSTSDPSCTDWIQRLDQIGSDTQEWQKRDAGVAAQQWTPEERALVEATQPLLTTYAANLVTIGGQSDNAVLSDFSTLSSHYFKAFVAAGDDYVSADSWLSYTGFQIANLVAGACRAAAS